MHISLELDDLDRQAIARMSAECICWRLNRYIYLFMCLAVVFSASGQFIMATLNGWHVPHLLIGIIGVPLGIILCLQLYRRWNGPAWSQLANKLAIATSPDV